MRYSRLKIALISRYRYTIWWKLEEIEIRKEIEIIITERINSFYSFLIGDGMKGATTTKKDCAIQDGI